MLNYELTDEELIPIIGHASSFALIIIELNGLLPGDTIKQKVAVAGE